MADDQKTTPLSKFVSVAASALNLLSRSRNAEENESVVESEQNVKNCNGWYRLKQLYTDGDVHFETGILKPCMEWTFIGTVLLKGPSGWQKAAERYSRYSKGRIFLNTRDALRRKWDYAFASFLRNGAVNGALTALYVGFMLVANTHLAAWRGHFSLWTVPVTTTVVPCIIAFPFGLPTVIQAASLGFTCGLTLSLVFFSASFFSNQTVNEVYQTIKHEYEMKMRKNRNYDELVTTYQKEHNIWLKSLAELQMNREKASKKDQLLENPSV